MYKKKVGGGNERLAVLYTQVDVVAVCFFLLFLTICVEEMKWEEKIERNSVFSWFAVEGVLRTFFYSYAVEWLVLSFLKDSILLRNKIINGNFYHF